MPTLMVLSESPEASPRLRPYDAARKWVEFVGEGSVSDPLVEGYQVDDDGSSGVVYEGSFPPASREVKELFVE
jgi:hypothetical protein